VVKVNSLLNYLGVYYAPNGNEYKGEWFNDELIEEGKD